MDAVKKCCECNFRKCLASKKSGKKIPGGTGKCTNPVGLCEVYIPAGNIGEAGERAPISRENK